MDWYQKFGLPQPEEGANEQGAAAPDADETPAGENGQEIAEPAETEEAEDHAADETRYAVMSRPWIPRVSAPPASSLPKHPGSYTIDQLIERNRQQRIAAEEF